MLPAKHDTRWAQVISGARPVRFETLALRVLMMRSKMEMERSPGSAQVIERWVDELYDFCRNNPELVRNDLEQIFGREAP
jgi:hypothetical protein